MEVAMKQIETVGWKPATPSEREAVIAHCVGLGMSRKMAEDFVRYNAIRKWRCCEYGSVEQAAKEWIASARRAGEPLGEEGRLKELAEEVAELRKTVEQIATLLCLVHGENGETDIGRVVAEMTEKRDALREFLAHYQRGVERRRGGNGLQREGFKENESVEPGGERVGGEGV